MNEQPEQLALRWTDQQPTVPGLYWYRDFYNEPQCLSIVRDYSGLCVTNDLTNPGLTSVVFYAGEWAVQSPNQWGRHEH